MITNSHNQPNGYMVSDDQRIVALQRRFEELLNGCPTELGGWQTFKIVRKPDAVFVEIVSTFKIDMVNAK